MHVRTGIITRIVSSIGIIDEGHHFREFNKYNIMIYSLWITLNLLNVFFHLSG